MKQFLLSVSLLIGAAINAQDCSELFISEYVEGWSNNKALELYNPTDQPIDLSQYILIRYRNGSTQITQQEAVQLNGTVQPYDVYVAVIDKRDQNGTGQDAPIWDSLEVRADGFYCPDYTISRAMYFNGNDGIALAKGDFSTPNGSQLVDFFGKLNEDPDNGQCQDAANTTCGWTTEFPYVAPAGVVVTTDHSLIRKSTILSGAVNPNISYFNALEEWDSIPPLVYNQNLGYEIGNWESLGSHECDCNANSVSAETMVKLGVYPNPSENGVFNFTSNDQVVAIDVFNTLGQNIFSEKNNNGIESVTIGNDKGVYLVNITTSNGTVASRRVVIK
jgi:hypothetical protein